MSALKIVAFALLSGAVMAFGSKAQAQGNAPYQRAPINYSRTTPHDEIARLVTRIANGEVKLTGSDQEILRAVLRELQIPLESQMTVFSRTSLQTQLIRPATPRALYFSDSVYVGWVPDGLIEVAAIDPELGPVFYGFDPQDARDHRRSFVRESSCLRCHGGTPNDDIPGLLARSVITNKDGEQVLRDDSQYVDDETAFELRWGGWYVTGYTGRQRHWGNVVSFEVDHQFDFNPSDERPMNLSGYLDTSRYLTTTSDVVALLVFDHQVTMHNSFTRGAQRFRRAVAEQSMPAKPAAETASAPPASDPVNAALATSADDIVDHLLFYHAARLPQGIQGVSEFQQAFAAGAKRGQSGDALKDLSLHGRLFANRCSFLIYSDSFTALPPPLKDRVLDRLYTALHDKDPRYAYLEPDEKRRIFNILLETLPAAQQRWPK